MYAVYVNVDIYKLSDTCTEESESERNTEVLSWHTNCTHRENYDLPEDGKEPRPKHVGAIINKQKHCATSFY
jgi:hypothetical protein